MLVWDRERTAYSRNLLDKLPRSRKSNFAENNIVPKELKCTSSQPRSTEARGEY